jgi:hypothetical protein
MGEKAIVLPDGEEMLRRLVAVNGDAHYQERFYPLLLKSAGKRLRPPGVVLMFTLAVRDYAQGASPVLATQAYMEVPDFVDALSTTKEWPKRSKPPSMRLWVDSAAGASAPRFGDRPGGHHPEEPALQPHGNGSGQYPIHQDDMGGWVRIFTDHPGPLPDNFAFLLSQILADWFRQRPYLRLRCAVPITREGNVVEMHAWYEVHVLPPRQPPAPASNGAP